MAFGHFHAHTNILRQTNRHMHTNKQRSSFHIAYLFQCVCEHYEYQREPHIHIYVYVRMNMYIHVYMYVYVCVCVLCIHQYILRL
jgi:hypothetical protein